MSLNRNQPDAAYNLGMVLLELQEPREAILSFRRAQALQPERPDIAFNLVRADLQAGELDSANEEIKKMWNAPALRAAAEEARRLLAAAYIESRQPERVPPLMENPQSADDYFLRASALFAQRRLGEAGEEENHAVQANPQEPRYLLLAARIAQSLGEEERALELFRRIGDLAPGWVEAPYGLAVSYYFEQRYTECRQSLDRGLALLPGCPRCLFLYGITLVNEGHNEQAIAYFRRAVQADPKNSRYHFHLGTAYSRDHRPAEAKESFERAIQLTPQYALPHYELGKGLADAGDSAAAIAQYERAIDCQPSLAQAYYQLGRVTAKIGQLEKSERAFRRFQELKSKTDEQKELAEDIGGELRHP